MSYVFNPFTGTLDNVGTSAKKLEEELALYFKLAGRSTTQVATFGTAANAEGRLVSTSEATKGFIILGPANKTGVVYNEKTNQLGVGAAPEAIIQASGVEPAESTNAATVVKFAGPTGGKTTVEQAGAGSKVIVTSGLGGAAKVTSGVAGRGGGGGTITFTAGAGGVSNGINAAENEAGGGGEFVFKGNGGGEASGSSVKNVGGIGGKFTFKAGQGGNAGGGVGTREGGVGGGMLLEAGRGGTASGGTPGAGGEMLLEAGTAGGATSTGGKFTIKAGSGSGTGVGGPFELITYKEGSSPGGTLEILSTGELLYKVEGSTKFVIKSTGVVETDAGFVVNGALTLPEGSIVESFIAKEAVTYPKMAFFSFDSPIEIAAGKTYEVPANIQGLWKESISVQGTLNVQGRFDEVGTPERIGTSELTGTVATSQITNEAVTPVQLSQFSRDAPYEIPAGKTCEVPELYQGLFKENLSLQGTLNVQGRFDEVGVPEPFNEWAPVGVPYEVPTGKTYEVPAFISSMWRESISVQGTMNIQGRMLEI